MLHSGLDAKHVALHNRHVRISGRPTLLLLLLLLAKYVCLLLLLTWAAP